MKKPSPRAPRNRTLTLSDEQKRSYAGTLLRPEQNLTLAEFQDRIICGDMNECIKYLPDGFVDLLILDPPYNLAKNFNGVRFNAVSFESYVEYLESWLPGLLRLLKPTASVYLCGDWLCSAAGFLVLSKYFTVRNRIVWQREKGRGIVRGNDESDGIFVRHFADEPRKLRGALVVFRRVGDIGIVKKQRDVKIFG